MRITQLLRSGRRGANAIEFALTLPFFLLIVLGLADYGFLFAMQAGLDNSVSMACREGSIEDPDTGPGPIATATIEWNNRSGMFCQSGCTFTATDLTAVPYAVPNRTLRCEAVRTMVPLTGFVPYPATINSVSYIRLEWQRP